MGEVEWGRGERVRGKGGRAPRKGALASSVSARRRMSGEREVSQGVEGAGQGRLKEHEIFCAFPK